MEQHIVTELFKKLDRPRWYRDQIKACCPFHDERTPSFSVGEVDGVPLFFCFGCGESGTINRLLAHIGSQYRVKLPEIKHRREQKEPDTKSIYRFDYTQYWPIYNDYFYERGISEDICAKFNFRFNFDGNSAIMPVYTESYFKGYIGRNLDPQLPRYYISDDMNIKRSIWGYDEIDFNKEVFIFEGIIDAATAWSNGQQAIALLGKAWKTKLDLLRELKKPVMVPDNDKVSFESFRELRATIGGLFHFVPPKFKDYNEWYLSGEMYDAD